jgi:hypothetical protein
MVTFLAVSHWTRLRECFSSTEWTSTFQRCDSSSLLHSVGLDELHCLLLCSSLDSIPNLVPVYPKKSQRHIFSPMINLKLVFAWWYWMSRLHIVEFAFWSTCWINVSSPAELRWQTTKRLWLCSPVSYLSQISWQPVGLLRFAEQNLGDSLHFIDSLPSFI